MKIPSVISALAILSLATTSAEPLRKTREESESRTETRWLREQTDREEAATIVRKLLRQPLTISAAVQVALLNSRNLQATYEDVGIAQANVVEAVTLPNPSVDFEVQFPVVAGSMNRYAWMVAQEFAQLLLIPLKKKISEAELDAVELRVAGETLNLVAEVKAGYFRAQAAQQLLSRLKLIQETNAVSLDLAQKQSKAGNITDLALLQMQASYSEGRLDLARAESDLRDRREEFNRLLGLWGGQTDWKIEGDIMPAPEAEFSAQGLESLAVSQRLDLRAAHRNLTSIVSALGLTKVYRWVPVLEFGSTGERDIEGALNMGPSFRLEVPIFNQGQARIARGTAELRRAENKLYALAVDIRSEVRELRDRLATLRDMAKFYHDDILPTRIRIVNQTLLEYNAMQIGAYDLFQAKSRELEAERAYIDTLRDYWITRAELERAVGGQLSLPLSTKRPIGKKS